MAEDDADRLFLFSSQEDEGPAIDLNFKISSEQDVWQIIREINNSDNVDLNIILDFVDLSWAKLDIVYRGAKYHQSLTANSMKGLVDFQTSFYQTVALIIHGSKKASVLTDDELAAFELVFNVNQGSSEVEAKGEDQLLQVLTKAITNMNPNHVAFAVCLAIVLYFGQGGLQAYLEHAAEMKKIEEQVHSEKGLQDIIRDQNQITRENLKLLGELVKKNDVAKEIVTGSINAHDSIVRHSNGSDGLDIKGQHISPKAVREIRS